VSALCPDERARTPSAHRSGRRSTPTGRRARPARWCGGGGIEPPCGTSGLRLCPSLGSAICVDQRPTRLHSAASFTTHAIPVCTTILTSIVSLNSVEMETVVATTHAMAAAPRLMPNPTAKPAPTIMESWRPGARGGYVPKTIPCSTPHRSKLHQRLGCPAILPGNGLRRWPLKSDPVWRKSDLVWRTSVGASRNADPCDCDGYL